MSSNQVTELICIEVGPKRDAMIVELNWFCTLSENFSDTRFYGQYIEAMRQNKPIWLADTSVDAFVDFLTWLNPSRFHPTPEIPQRSFSMRMQIEFWIHAEKMNIPTWQNQIVDDITSCTNETWTQWPSTPTPTFMMWIYSVLRPGSTLRRMFIYYLARSMLPHTTWFGSEAGLPATLVGDVNYLLQTKRPMLQTVRDSSTWHVPTHHVVHEHRDRGSQMTRLVVRSLPRRKRRASASPSKVPQTSLSHKNNQYLSAQGQPLASRHRGFSSTPPYVTHQQMDDSKQSLSVPQRPLPYFMPTANTLPPRTELFPTHFQPPSFQPFNSDNLPPQEVLLGTFSRSENERFPFLPPLTPESFRFGPPEIFPTTPQGQLMPPPSPSLGGPLPIGTFQGTPPRPPMPFFNTGISPSGGTFSVMPPPQLPTPDGHVHLPPTEPAQAALTELLTPLQAFNNASFPPVGTFTVTQSLPPVTDGDVVPAETSESHESHYDASENTEMGE
ncbi:hypothetical protein FKW77_000533 [Venturia effusa]|uniref:Uncharacterized protein n=1 Tax=Venturia effusa TaxID=50376 RepID=A0A517LAA5_9PEZI|nr:hypothetical protein FKW77_000533 [Venturia effusa]